MGGTTMGLGLDDDLGDLGGGGGVGHEYSRSSTPPLGRSTPATTGPLCASLSFEQLCHVGALLCAGIGSAFDTKRKDNSGKTYHNCFMGKEASNWYVAPPLAIWHVMCHIRMQQNDSR
jgi:hypothetical protein